MSEKKTGISDDAREPLTMSRKAFLRLSGAGIVAAALGGKAGAQPAPRAAGAAMPAGAAPRRTLIRNADVLTMDAQFRELHAVDVLIDDGRVVADGIHSELLSTSPRYREVLAQASALHGPAATAHSDAASGADAPQPTGGGSG